MKSLVCTSILRAADFASSESGQRENFIEFTSTCFKNSGLRHKLPVVFDFYIAALVVSKNTTS